MQKKYVRVGCYVRVSTENQIENYSIEEQISRLKAFCFSKDWNVTKFYTDAGYSGGNINRPALNQMLQDIYGNKLDIVVVYKLDRLSRSQKDTLTLIEDEFISHSVDFVSMSENFDTSTPFGRAMIGILSVFAQLEKDQITERFTMGRIGRGKAGYYHGGATSPTGYTYKDGLLEVDEYKAMQVREVYDRFLNGFSVNSIRNYMSNKYGGWSSHSLVINVLRNSIYIGKVKFKKKEYLGLHKPIIDPDTFSRAQKLLCSSEREEAKTTAQKTPFRAGFMLSSLVYCSKCGARYSANHSYYKCYSRAKTCKKFIVDPNCKNENWKIEELDVIVIEELRKIIYDNDYFERNFKIDSAKKVNTNDIADRLKKIDIQISKMIDLYQISEIPIEQISEKISKLQKEKDLLASSLLNEGAQIEEIRARLLQARHEFVQIFEDGGIEEKRLFISSFVEKVFIDDKSVNIAWRFGEQN